MTIVAASALCAAPQSVQAAPLTLGRVFADAAVPMQLIMVLLLAAAAAALVVGVLKLRSGKVLNGGSAFLSALRLGGPLLGLLGASYVGLLMLMGVANSPEPVPARVLAPGYAELVLLIGLGLLAGAVAVVFHWAVEARIDRQVLRP
jgi:hypothetical protein